MNLQSNKYHDRLRNIQIGLTWLTTAGLGYHPEEAKAFLNALKPYLTKQLTIGILDKLIDAKPFTTERFSRNIPLVSLKDLEGHIDALIPEKEKIRLGLK